MPNTLVRLKRQPSGGEDQVVIMVQYKQKQYPVPVPSVKVRPELFDPAAYGKWLTKSYQTPEGGTRNAKTINTRIRSFKTKVDAALDNLTYVGFEKMSVGLIKRSLGKSEQEIRENIDIMVDAFYDTPLLVAFQEFLDYKKSIGAKDIKNFKAAYDHLTTFEASLSTPVLMKEVDTQLLDRFTWFLLDKPMDESKPLDDRFNYYSHDTIFKQVKKTKVFIEDCRTRLNKTMPKITYRFPYKRTLDVMNPIALHPVELDQLYYLIHTFDTPTQNVVKLFFLSYSLGGQRISDITQLVETGAYKEDIKAYWQQKTGRQIYATILDGYFGKFSRDELYIPKKTANHYLKKAFGAILTKYNQEPAYKAHINKFVNGDEQPIDRYVRYVSYRGRSAQPLYSDYKHIKDAFNFSTARKTFISHLIYKYKKTKEEVKLFTGHSSDQIIDYYLDKRTQLETYDRNQQIIKPEDQYDYELMQYYDSIDFLANTSYYDPVQDEAELLADIEEQRRIRED